MNFSGNFFLHISPKIFQFFIIFNYKSNNNKNYKQFKDFQYIEITPELFSSKLSLLISHF